MTEDNTACVVRLGWSLSRKRGDLDKDAVLAAKDKDKIKFAGIVADYDEILAGGEKLLLDGREVGEVNSPAYSHRMQTSLALVHLVPEACAVGTKLEVQGEDMSCSATVERIPFYDPDKTRTHA